MSEDFLKLRGKNLLVMGIANRKSVAYAVGRVLEECGAHVIYSVRSPDRLAIVLKLLPDRTIYVCDVEYPEQIASLARQVQRDVPRLDGLVHAIAFADYPAERRSFHETEKSPFLRSVDISCYSLLAVCHEMRPSLDHDASVVTISISTTRMASASYGFMGPVKAALDSSIVFLAKSFSEFSRVRFNAVAPGLLKTSASAGIPGYVDSYLFAEKVIPRRRAVTTEEVAHVAAFLLSPRSSGINGQSIVIDAGMSFNYFDAQVIRGARLDAVAGAQWFVKSLRGEVTRGGVGEVWRR